MLEFDWGKLRPIWLPISLTTRPLTVVRTGLTVCQTFGFISTITALSSILTVLAMSIERAVVIRSNVAAKSRFTVRVAWFVTILIWLLSFLANLPPLLFDPFKYTLDPSKTGCFREYPNSHGRTTQLNS